MASRYATSACWGKEGYLTRLEALEAATRASTKTRVAIATYRCKECHAWHIGHAGRDVDNRIDPKQWKNWNWRKVASVE